MVFGDTFDGYGELNKCWVSDLERVTPQEIEDHLRKICDEKYEGKRIKSLGDGHIGTVIQGSSYYLEDDSFWVNDENGVLLLYRDGKFAEIVPQKKKLPKTKKELKELMCNWKYYVPNENVDIDKFLDDYEE